MDLYIIRHAIAEKRDAARWPDDSQRPLTDRGRTRFRAVAALLGEVAPDLDVLLSSGFARAWETAEIVSEIAGWPAPKRAEAMELGSSQEMCEAIAAHDRAPSVAVVGHEPCLSELVSYLLTGDDAAVEMDFKKGAAAFLSLPGRPAPGDALLTWVLTPRLARALA
ncbi:MAG: histidine phosphatase family protein [Planctomycetota bacterium]|nr:histidine phosphatase family protein [Planctomycetota bacterium]